MSERQTKIVGFAMLTFLSVMLWTPFISWMNTNLPTDGIGDSLGAFFWLVYPILILYFIMRLLQSLLYG